MELNYYNPRHAGSFSGVDKAYRAQKSLSRKEVKQWLKGEDAYTLHKPVAYRFRRNRVVVSGLDAQWDSDLMVLISHEEQNNGYRYVLVAVDILSRYAWTRALKTKSGKEVADAFESIFAEGRKPWKIRTDQGSEFKNRTVQRMFQKEKVENFQTNNEVKSNYAERLIRTLKLKLWRYSTYKQTHKWIDIIQDITHSYNNTFHRSISQTPSSVNRENESEVWQKVYKSVPMKSDGPFKFDINDYVRISHLKKAFDRDYEERYTGEIFIIESRFVRNGINIYKLKDFQNEAVLGTFYEVELQLIKADPSGVYKVEKIIKKRKRRANEEYLIKWRYWPDKFNSWVKASDLQDI